MHKFLCVALQVVADPEAVERKRQEAQERAAQALQEGRAGLRPDDPAEITPSPAPEKEKAAEPAEGPKGPGGGNQFINMLKS